MTNWIPPLESLRDAAEFIGERIAEAEERPGHRGDSLQQITQLVKYDGWEEWYKDRSFQEVYDLAVVTLSTKQDLEEMWPRLTDAARRLHIIAVGVG